MPKEAVLKRDMGPEVGPEVDAISLLCRKQTFSEKMLHYSVKLLKCLNFQQNVWMPFYLFMISTISGDGGLIANGD